jgi:glycosyltransferase involved in cell wall biosynthesis
MKLLNTTTFSQQPGNELAMPENILVFSHLRWDFVFQRPQHLLTRFAKNASVTFIEEPVFDDTNKPCYTFTVRQQNVIVMTPHLPQQYANDGKVTDVLKAMFTDFMKNKNLSNYAFWYYTPMALEFSQKYTPRLVIYDCMDELSAFKFAPARLKVLEQQLLKISDIVFTGGRSLYEAKKHQHANIFAFPSSIDKKHFQQVRNIATRVEKPEGAPIKLGFYGVIDERFDIDLIKHIADARPQWELELIGPVVKIDPDLLPQNSNITYTGSQSYEDLPGFMADWDIALIPFLLNESTRFISPTKTPEYLAAGLPVVSTPIKDVINPYGNNRLVQIATNAAEFIEEAEYYLSFSAPQRNAWLNRVDQFLELNSWDRTCNNMLARINDVLAQKMQTPLANII